MMNDTNPGYKSGRGTATRRESSSGAGPAGPGEGMVGA